MVNALDSSRANCRLEPQLLYEALRPGHLEYQMCRGIIYRYRFDDGVGFNTYARTNDWWIHFRKFSMLTKRVHLVMRRFISKTSSQNSLKRNSGFFEGMYGTENITLEQVTEIHDGCLSLLPNARRHFPPMRLWRMVRCKIIRVTWAPWARLSWKPCKHARALEAARAAIAEHVEAYNIAVQSCHYGSQAGSVQETLMENHAVME